MSKTALNSLFTNESLVSLQGAATLTLLVPNVLGYVIGPSFFPYQKWVGLGVAMFLSLYTAAQAPTKNSGKWIMAIFNGFLIFASASGLTDALGAGGASGSASAPAPTFGDVNPFFHSWYH